MTAQNDQQAAAGFQHAHPQVAEAMQQMQRLQSVLEGAVNQTATETFTGTDEDKTVSVTVDGQHSLTELYIEDGLLRLGAATVEQRLNEALSNADAAATEAVTAQHQQLFATLTEITGGLKTGLGMD